MLFTTNHYQKYYSLEISRHLFKNGKCGLFFFFLTRYFMVNENLSSIVDCTVTSNLYAHVGLLQFFVLFCVNMIEYLMGMYSASCSNKIGEGIA